MVDALDELPDELPEAFVEEAERRSGGEVPATFSEPDVGRGPPTTRRGPSPTRSARRSSTRERPHEARVHAGARQRHADDARTRPGGRHGVPDQLLARHRGGARARGRARPEVEADVGRSLSILADLPGPKVRLGELDPIRSRSVGPAVRAPPTARATRPAPPRRTRASRATSARATASCSPTAPRSWSSAHGRRRRVTECVRGGAVRSHPGGERAGGAARPPAGHRPRPRDAPARPRPRRRPGRAVVRPRPADVEQLREAMGTARSRSSKIETRPAVEDFERILELPTR